ncbi:MAG: hypothetical protein UY22_C0055G0002 [Candidatus Amesbacteria bacterium GW2011_GWC1_48_10]|uniref:Four helix bundle protein n=1 Tax=Candidatus Amesbacteria bacterium GW2011_GWC1_48_10 TaxID=1618365 RepID=A0A0G1X7S7_9BACT|nr:MAG: hypothetical protein UY22_C0055G0002 [Candidatus Amesbacteria bacterium GW2011_GWC1_48_10]
MTQVSNKYDLEERTTVFAERIVDLCKRCPKNSVTIPILDQLIRSGTSIGANYCEANVASSKKDFNSKIFICKKESRETKYWLRLLGGALDDENLKQECRDLWKEAQEFNLIFSKIVSKKKVLNEN